MFNLVKKNNLNYFNYFKIKCNNNNNKLVNSYLYSNVKINNNYKNYSTINNKKGDNEENDNDQDDEINNIGIDGNNNSNNNKLFEQFMENIQNSGLKYEDLKNIKDLNDIKKFKLDKGIKLGNNQQEENYDEIDTEDITITEDGLDGNEEDYEYFDNDKENGIPKATFKFKQWKKRPKSNFPKTSINLKKKINLNLILDNKLNQLKDIKNNNNELSSIKTTTTTTNIIEKKEEIKKEKSIQQSIESQQPKQQQQQQQQQQKDIFGFGLNNIKFDKNFELKKKEEEIKRKEEEIKKKREELLKEKQLKLLEKQEKLKQEKLIKRQSLIKLKELKNEKYSKLSEIVYKKIKKFNLNRNKNRFLNQIKSMNLSTIKFNKNDPFQNYFNLDELNKTLMKYKENYKEQGIGESNDNHDMVLSFKERLNLHLYSFQLYLQSNLYKDSSSEMLFNNLNKLILQETDKKLLEESIEKEDYFKLFEIVRKYHQKDFIQENLALSYSFNYLKKHSKFYRFFQLLENININQKITPLDYSDMIQAFLNDDQITSAEMLTSNMDQYFQEFYPEVFIHYYEYFKKQYPQPEYKVEQIFDEFINILNQHSATEKEFMALYKPIIERERFKILQSGQTFTEDHIDKIIRDNPLENQKQLRNLNLYKPILIHCYKNNDIEFVELLEDKLEREGIKLDLETFNNKIKCQVTEGIYIGEENLPTLAYNYKPKNNNKKNKKKSSSDPDSDNSFKGNSQTFMAILYHQLIVEKNINQSINILERLKSKWNFKMNKFVLNQLIFGLSRLGDIKSTINYYNQLKELSNTSPSSSLDTNNIDNMNNSTILYCMSYYNYHSIDIVNFIKDNNCLIGKPTLDLIVYGYLLNNKFKQLNNFKTQSLTESSTSTNNNIENLIEVLNYLVNENNLIIDNNLNQFLLSRLNDLKKQYNIKPSKNHFILLKNLINKK